MVVRAEKRSDLCGARLADRLIHSPTLRCDRLHLSIEALALQNVLRLPLDERVEPEMPAKKLDVILGAVMLLVADYEGK